MLAPAGRALDTSGNGLTLSALIKLLSILWGDPIGESGRGVEKSDHVGCSCRSAAMSSLRLLKCWLIRIDRALLQLIARAVA